MVDITLFIALAAGLVSFLSPCVLPIVPGFLSYLAGQGGEQSPKKQRRLMIVHSIWFVVGFSLVFALLGVLLNTVLESVAFDAQQWFARIGGVVVIFFGLYLTKLIRIPWLERDHKVKVAKKSRFPFINSILFGSAFAAGWTPCVGAALGAILGLAATDPAQAFPLLLAYAVGLGAPFILVGIFAEPAQRLINRSAGKLDWVNKVFGAILIVLGILVFTQKLHVISNFGLAQNLLS